MGMPLPGMMVYTLKRNLGPINYTKAHRNSISTFWNGCWGAEMNDPLQDISQIGDEI